MHRILPSLCSCLFYGSIQDPKQQTKQFSTFRSDRGNPCGGPILAAAITAAFEDIFNNDADYFIDICPLQSQDNVIRIGACGCLCVCDTPFFLLFIYSFFSKKQRMAALCERALVSGINSITFSDCRKDN